MDPQAWELQYKAKIARIRFMRKEINLDRARAEVQPFIDYYNNFSDERAKEFGLKSKHITVSGFLR